MVPELTGQECWSAVNLEEFLFISLSSPPGSSLAHRCLLNPYWTCHWWGEGGLQREKGGKERTTFNVRPILLFAMIFSWYTE